MTFKQTMAAIFNTAEGTYYKWKRENRPIITLLEKYFTQKDLEEYIETGKISRFELHQNQKAKSNYSASKYLNIFTQKKYKIADIINKKFMDFYFNTLIYCKNNINNINVFNPMTIQKASLNYMHQVNHNETEDLGIPIFLRKVPNDDLEDGLKQKKELVPTYEIGLELLDDFDCYTNQFLQDCIFQDFKPLIDFIQNDDVEISINDKVEAYSHILLFITYEYHHNNTAEEKMTLLLMLLRALENTKQTKVDKKTDLTTAPIIDFLENTSLDVRIKQNLDVIEKNFDKILLAIKSYNFDEVAND